MTKSIVIPALLLLSACGDEVYPERVQSGTYRLDYQSGATFESGTTLEPGSLTIEVDTAGRTATLVQEGSPAQALLLLATPKEQWLKDCFTMNSHALDEVYLVTPDPLVLSGLSIPHPVLTTKCGGRLLLGSLSGGALTGPELGFNAL